MKLLSNLSKCPVSNSRNISFELCAINYKNYMIKLTPSFKVNSANRQGKQCIDRHVCMRTYMHGYHY